MYCTKTVKAPLKSPPSRGAWIEIMRLAVLVAGY